MTSNSWYDIHKKKETCLTHCNEAGIDVVWWVVSISIQHYSCCIIWWVDKQNTNRSSPCVSIPNTNSSTLHIDYPKLMVIYNFWSVTALSLSPPMERQTKGSSNHHYNIFNLNTFPWLYHLCCCQSIVVPSVEKVKNERMTEQSICPVKTVNNKFSIPN